ncbi:MAG TPA: hypothetical protein VII55_01615, partial [Candidatus Saccharimonadales bacterium]
MALAVTERLDRLSLVGSWAQTRNPFAVRTGPVEPDLSALSPELEEFVVDYRAGRASQNNFGLSDGHFVANERARVIKTSIKLGVAALQLQVRLENHKDATASDLTSTARAIGELSAEDQAGDAAEFDLNRVGSLMVALTDAAERLPSPSSIEGLRVIYAARNAPMDHQHRALRRRVSRPFSIVSRFWQTASVFGLETSLKVMRIGAKAKDLGRDVTQTRETGSRYHGELVGLLKAQRVREAIQALGVISDAKDQFPGPEGMDSAAQGTALAAEEYLAAKANQARATIIAIDPRRFDKDEQLQAISNRARTTSFAAAVATKHSLEEAVRREAYEAAIGGPDFRTVSEVRDILLGGRRLSVTGKSHTEIMATATTVADIAIEDRGKRSLNHEECGVVMAIVMDRFDDFTAALQAMKGMDIDPSAPLSRRVERIQEIRDFDLDHALVKISAFLSDSERRRQIASIVGREEMRRV